MRDKGWIEEAWGLAIILLGGVLLGWLFGHVLATMLGVLTLYIIRHLYALKRFISWVEDPVGKRLPVRFGVWSGVFAGVSRLTDAQLASERRLHTSLEQFQSATAALPDAVVGLGPSDEIRWMNNAAQELLGLRSPGDYGRPIANLFRAPAFQQFLAQRDFQQTLELAAPGKDGQQLSLRAVPYGQEQLLIIVQDVTQRYQVERMRRDFVANVSHELRTPLTVISGFAENMLTDEDLCPAPWRKSLALISEQTARMQHIVEDLLLLARLEVGEKNLRREAVDVAAMLQKLAQEAQLLTDKDIEISVNIESEWQLAADPGLLRSAISNLVINALHHTPGGGRIILQWVDEPGASCIVVQDTGEGIAAEHIPRLTERFYRVDTGRSRERGGTGLGLAIVKHILQVHDGALEIRSTPGHGSQFMCCFPAGLRAEPEGQLAPSQGLDDNGAQSTR